MRCTTCHEPGHTHQDCLKQKHYHFCEKGGRDDKECYYLKGFCHLQQHIPQLALAAPQFSQQVVTG